MVQSSKKSNTEHVKNVYSNHYFNKRLFKFSNKRWGSLRENFFWQAVALMRNPWKKKAYRIRWSWTRILNSFKQWVYGGQIGRLPYILLFVGACCVGDYAIKWGQSRVFSPVSQQRPLLSWTNVGWSYGEVIIGCHSFNIWFCWGVPGTASVF